MVPQTLVYLEDIVIFEIAKLKNQYEKVPGIGRFGFVFAYQLCGSTSLQHKSGKEQTKVL